VILINYAAPVFQGCWRIFIPHWFWNTWIPWPQCTHQLHGRCSWIQQQSCHEPSHGIPHMSMQSSYLWLWHSYSHMWESWCVKMRSSGLWTLPGTTTAMD
jgi:hypothetical protein